MVDTRRSTSAKSKTKSAPTTRQRTLFDLFPPKVEASLSQSQEVQVEPDDTTQSTPMASASTASTSTHVEDAEEIALAPVVEKLRQASLEPRPLHPFFSKSLAPVASEKSNSSQETIIEIVEGDGSDESAPTNPDPIVLLPEGGSQEDPIVLDSSPLKPLRPKKAVVPKPLAPLFARRRPKFVPLPPTSQIPEVIVLDVPDKAVAPKPKLAPLFAPRPQKVAASLASHASNAREQDPPFPNKDMQHVRGPQHAFSAPVLPYGLRINHRGASPPQQASSESIKLGSLLSETATSFISSSDPSPLDHESYLNTIPAEHLQHPAISRLTSTSHSDTSTHQLWIDKWRPSRASEILGNEENAIFLRDWIHALELQLESSEVPQSEHLISKGKSKLKKETLRGTKRPRTVVRAVEKKRGRKKRRIDSDDEDDWIVYSADNFSSVAASSPPPYEAPSSPLPPSSPPPPEPASLPEPAPQPFSRYTFDPLTNTILIAGPSGSGKTAAVYACAEELGWDVLEVYPGIGRRNGPGIESLIGDAGTNHHVRQTRVANSNASMASGTLKHLFKERGSNDVPCADEGVAEPEPGDSMLAPTRVRQSLILLEEVDILFKEDTSFWPAVTNFIKDCRRPVICTCNDISLVPTQDLPLQTILTFQPCAPALAVSHLQALCYSEGHYLLDRNALLRLYEDSTPHLEMIDVPDIPNPTTSGDFPAPDIRRTINALQFLCASGSKIGNPSRPAVSDMCNWDRSWENEPRNINVADQESVDQGEIATVMRREAPPGSWARHTDLLSFVDTYLVRGIWDTPEGLGWSSCEVSNDDEVGHTNLFCLRESRGSFGISMDARDAEMASVVMGLSRGALEAGMTREPTSSCISPCRTRELFRARVDHQLDIEKGLNGIVPLSVLRMRRCEVHVDYTTSVRDVVAAEDSWELMYMQRARTGRSTRNSGGTYERTLYVSTEGRAALARSVLV